MNVTIVSIASLILLGWFVFGNTFYSMFILDRAMFWIAIAISILVVVLGFIIAAKNLVDTFDGDFQNAVVNHDAVSFGGGYAVFEDGSAVCGNDYSVRVVDADAARAAIEQQ